MFSKAVPIAAGFTRPMVISSRTTQGACAGTIGAYVVVTRSNSISQRDDLAAIGRHVATISPPHNSVAIKLHTATVSAGPVGARLRVVRASTFLPRYTPDYLDRQRCPMSDHLLNTTA